MTEMQSKGTPHRIVTIGRQFGAADCILREEYDVVSVFLTAPLPDRVRHVAQRDAISPEEAGRKIARLDQARASYYNSFSQRKWGKADSFDLCLNVGRIGEDAAAKTILRFLETIKTAQWYPVSNYTTILCLLHKRFVPPYHKASKRRYMPNKNQIKTQEVIDYENRGCMCQWPGRDPGGQGGSGPGPGRYRRGARGQ